MNTTSPTNMPTAATTGEEGGNPNDSLFGMSFEIKEATSSDNPVKVTELTETSQLKPEIQVYLNALVHSTYCTNETCSFQKCLSFKRVTRHNKNCKKFRNDNCDFCRQLIALSIYHAKTCSNHTTCLVSFCFSIKQKLETNKSIEFVTNQLNVLKQTSKANVGIQVCLPMQTAETNENKRKFSHLDIESNLISPQETEEIDCHEQNTDSEAKKNVIFEKFKEIKELIKENSIIANVNRVKLNRISRDCIFQALYKQFILGNGLFGGMFTDTEFAALIAFLLRNESELFEKSSGDTTIYLYLLTELFYNLGRNLDKKKVNPSIEVQTEPQQADYQDEMPNKRLRTE